MMAHAASLFWMLLGLVAVDCVREQGIGVWVPVAGMSLGMLFLTRPFDAALVGPVVGLWALGARARLRSFGALLGIGSASAAVAGLFFWYNSALTGHPTLAPQALWTTTLFGPGIEVLGFGPRVGSLPMWQNIDPLPGHGFADVVLNANKNFTQLNFELFGWPFGSLVLACLAVQRGGIRRQDALIVGIVLSVIIGHSFYWAPGGPDFGPRYWYLIIVPLAALTVRGAERAVVRLSASRHGGFGAAGGILAVIFAASLSSWMTLVPWRATVKYDRYRGISGDFGRIAKRHGIEGALVFVRSPRRSDYQAAFVMNPRTLDGSGNIFVRDIGGSHTMALLQRFPTRPIWLVGRESEADETLDVIAGPLPPGTTPPGVSLTSLDTFQAVVR
jgi:hypothetical protein